MSSANAFEIAFDELRDAGMAIHDCHGHIGPAFNFANVAAGPADLVRTMDLAAIRTSFVSALYGVADEELGHKELMDGSKLYPSRLRPVPIANPNHGADTLAYLEQCRADPTVRVLKVHPTLHDYPVAGPAYGPIFDLAAEAGWPVLSHTWSGGPDPSEFSVLARRHPRTTFILGHSGGVLPGIRAAVEVTRTNANVYCDLACSIAYDGVLEWMVDQIGDERILFGSDATFFDPRPQIGRVVMARIPLESRLRILGSNLCRLVPAIPAEVGADAPSMGDA